MLSLMNRWREKRGSVAEATSLRFRQVRILSFKTLKTFKPKATYRCIWKQLQDQRLSFIIPTAALAMQNSADSSTDEFCQTSSVFSDPLDLLDHPLLLDIFFRGAPQLRAGVGFYFFTKCPLRNTLVVTFRLCNCALEIDLKKNSVSIHM